MFLIIINFFTLFTELRICAFIAICHGVPIAMDSTYNTTWVKPGALTEIERAGLYTNGLWGRLHVIHHTTVTV